MALALAICVTIGRGYFALAATACCRRCSPRRRATTRPWVGNLMVVVGGVGLMLLASRELRDAVRLRRPDGKFIPLFPNDEFATFIISAATVGSFAIELVYLVLALAHCWDACTESGGKWWQYLIVLVAIATPILGFYGALKPEPHDSSNYNYVALYWTIGVIVLAALWFVTPMSVLPAADVFGQSSLPLPSAK